MGKKIAFIGPHGTGKTTLGYDLTLELRTKGVNAFSLEEAARNCPLPINEESVPETQLWLITAQISKELEKERSYDVVVCDRSILDSYCYHNYFFGREKNWEPLIEEYMKKYDDIIYVPIRKGFLKEDGIRSTDKKFQKGVNEIFLKNLKNFDIDYKTFNENTIRELCKKYSP